MIARGSGSDELGRSRAGSVIMKGVDRINLLFFFSLLLGSLSWGQEKQDEENPTADEAPAEDPADEGFRIGVAVDQVFLSVNARSLEGGFVRGLRQDQFQVYEDGVKQRIVNFSSEAVPVHVVLLVDISGSTRDSLPVIRRAALRFAKSLGPEDRIAVITFNDAPRLILNWTNDLKKIENALLSVYAKGQTVLNDALYVTCDDLLKDVEGKKAIILLTDGVDTGSMVNYQEAVELGIRSEAIVYVASKLDEYWGMAIAARMEFVARARIVPRQLTDEFILEVRRFLQKLANQTGGRVLNSQAFSSLIDVYAQVAEELKNQYYISYVPSNRLKDGSWRNITLRVINPATVVGTRPGYYAPSE